MHHLAIFASGSGTNAENIMEYFQYAPQIRVACVCTNRSDAYVIERAKRFDIPVMVFSKKDFYETETVLNYLLNNQISWIILAGFLWLVPPNLIEAYPNRIINIHPALLPKYGGKGMYGHHVHQAVIENKEPVSGISVHYVNKEYDRGDIIFQVTCPVMPGDTPDSLAERVHELEYRHFPEVIEKVILTSTHS
jgi:phosphoribosylglycinamide formyltransferase-1